MRNTNDGAQLVSVRIPRQSLARVTRLARKRKTTVSALIREAVDALAGQERPTIWDQVKALVPKNGSGLGDLSTHKRHLADFGED